MEIIELDKNEPFQLKLTVREFDEICKLKILHRLDWPASFGCNGDGDVWPQVGSGRSSQCERVRVERQLPKLAKVGDFLFRVRPDCGRFFVNKKGAYWRDRQLKYHLFVRCQSDELDRLQDADIRSLKESLRGNLELWKQFGGSQEQIDIEVHRYSNWFESIEP